MGRVIPFSGVDIYFQNLSNRNGCLVDSNFLIAVTEENHPFNEEAQFMFEKLSETFKRIKILIETQKFLAKKPTALVRAKDPEHAKCQRAFSALWILYPTQRAY